MNYFFENSEIDANMRAILVDYIVDVCCACRLNDESLHTSINILDNFCVLSLNYVKRQNYQLIGLTCLLIACKIEEIHHPTISDFVYMAAGAFDSQDMINCEFDILQTLNYDVMKKSIAFNLRKYDYRTRYYIDTILLNAFLTSKYTEDEILEACVELGKTDGRFWSECMDEIDAFEKANKYKTVKSKYQRLTTNE